GVVEQGVDLVLVVLHGHAHGGGAEPPPALQRPGLCTGRLYEYLVRRTHDAAATAVILHAHRQHVAARAQGAGRHLVHARPAVGIDRAADLLTIDPGGVGVVDLADAQGDPGASLGRAEFEGGAIPGHAVHASVD